MILRLIFIILTYNKKNIVDSFSFSYFNYNFNNKVLTKVVVKNYSKLFAFQQGLAYYCLLLLFYIFVYLALVFNLTNCVYIIWICVLYKLISGLNYVYIIYTYSPLSSKVYIYHSNMGFFGSLYVNVVTNLLNNLNILIKYGLHILNIIVSFYFIVAFLINFNWSMLENAITLLKNFSLFNVVYCQPADNYSPSTSASLWPVNMFTPFNCNSTNSFYRCHGSWRGFGCKLYLLDSS